MKGVIFNVLEQFVDEKVGLNIWDKCLKELKIENKVFVPTKCYEDSELLSIFGKVLSYKKMAADTALISFGEYLFTVLDSKYADLVDEYKCPKDFILALDSVIHVEVRKMMANSTPPSFLTVSDEGKKLVLEYRSKRQLCELAIGLFNGLVKKYDGAFSFNHSCCCKKGDVKCLFEFEFSYVWSTL